MKASGFMMLFGYELVSSVTSANNMIANFMVVSSQHKILYQVTAHQSTVTSIIQRKCDTVFQIMFSIVHNIENVSLLHAFVTQAINDISRSKKLIKTMNCLGNFNNHHEMLLIHLLLARKLMQDTGQHRVLNAKEIKS